MGTISIFSLDFPGLKLACSRSFDGAYHLKAGDYTVTMTPDVASALAWGGTHIRIRAQTAVRCGKEMRSGATFRRSMLAVCGRTANIEFGVADDGGGIYVEIAGTRLALADGQAQMLLFVLDQLGRDVTTINRASETLVPNFGAARSMRGFDFPWETGEW